MTDPSTMTDADLAALLAIEQRRAPEVKAAAERAAAELADNTAAIKALTAEAEFRLALKELRRKSRAARVEVLRALSTAEKPIYVAGPTDWLEGHGLIRGRKVGYSRREDYHHSITALGRRALAALESA